MNLKILGSSSWLLLAQALVKIISFFYTLFLARNLGVENFGYYVAALAYFSLFSSVSDLGFNRYLIREGARYPESISKLLSSVLILRLTLICLALASFAVILYLIDNDLARVSFSLLAVLAVIPQSIALTFDGVLVALQKLKYSAIGLLILSISTTVIGIYLVSDSQNVFGALIALILGQLIYAGVNYLLIHASDKKLIVTLTKEELKAVMSGSLPYGILGILGLLYFRVDTLLLSYLKGATETGLYGVSYRFLEAIIFIPSAFATTLFPVLAKLESQQEVTKVYWKSIKLLGLIAIPITVGYIFILPIMINYFLPQYTESLTAIKILALTIPFMFLHIPGAMVLTATERYLKPVIYLSFITLGFNIIANLILIPIYGLYAACWVTVLSEALSLVIFFNLLYQKVLRDD